MLRLLQRLGELPRRVRHALQLSTDLICSVSNGHVHPGCPTDAAELLKQRIRLKGISLRDRPGGLLGRWRGGRRGRRRHGDDAHHRTRGGNAIRRHRVGTSTTEQILHWNEAVT